MPSKFFRVDGADQESGEETYLVLQAKTKPQAEKLARDQGLLVASVREAHAEDWAAPSEDSAPPTESSYEPETEAPAHDQAHAHAEHEHVPEHDEFIEPVPTIQQPVHYTIEPGTSPAHEGASPSGPPTAAAVVLASAGSAIVLGGVLALALALWPDNAVRNDLQQIDYRLHALIQTVLGSMLVVGGLMVFLIAVICYVVPKRGS